MCIYDDRNSVFRGKTNTCNANFGDLRANGDSGKKICRQKYHVWNRQSWFAYLLHNFYGSTMMIKGSSLFSAPIIGTFGSG